MKKARRSPSTLRGNRAGGRISADQTVSSFRGREPDHAGRRLSQPAAVLPRKLNDLCLEELGFLYVGKKSCQTRRSKLEWRQRSCRAPHGISVAPAATQGGSEAARYCPFNNTFTMQLASSRSLDLLSCCRVVGMKCGPNPHTMSVDGGCWIRHLGQLDVLCLVGLPGCRKKCTVL